MDNIIRMLEDCVSGVRNGIKEEDTKKIYRSLFRMKKVIDVAIDTVGELNKKEEEEVIE